ncbi:hypothetical protein Ancab_005602 [Ancistrocladus abbreviatus]
MLMRPLMWWGLRDGIRRLREEVRSLELGFLIASEMVNKKGSFRWSCDADDVGGGEYQGRGHRLFAQAVCRVNVECSGDVLEIQTAKLGTLRERRRAHRPPWLSN